MSWGPTYERWMWDEQGLALPRRSAEIDVFALLWTIADADGLVQPVLIGSITYYLGLTFREAEEALAALKGRGLVSVKQHRRNECLYLVKVDDGAVGRAIARVRCPSLEADLLIGKPVMAS